MSSDAERLLIECGLMQYHTRLMGANMCTFAQLQRRKELIPSLIGNAAHSQLILDTLGQKGTAATGDGVGHDLVEEQLESWEQQLRQRLRLLAGRQANRMLQPPEQAGAHRRPPPGALRSAGRTAGSNTSSSGKIEFLRQQEKIEHCKALLAATIGGRKAHRKYVELQRLLARYRNRAGDPGEVDATKQRLAELETYVKQILVTLEEEAKLHGVGVLEDPPVESHQDPSSERPTQKQNPSSSSSTAALVKDMARLEREVALLRDSGRSQIFGAALQLYNSKRAYVVKEKEMEMRRSIEWEWMTASFDLMRLRTGHQTEPADVEGLVLRAVDSATTTAAAV